MRIANGLLFLGVLSGCFASVTSVAHDKFATDYECPTAEESAAYGDIVEVVGCNRHQQFTCVPGFATHHDRTDTTCSYRSRVGYVASDGTQHVAWADDVSVVYETAIASAAHDLPCGQTAITKIDSLTLEGCGQRVTYREVPLELYRIDTKPEDYRVTTAYRYVLVGRVGTK